MAASTLQSFYWIPIPISSLLKSPKTKSPAFTTSSDSHSTAKSQPLSLHIGAFPKPSPHTVLDFPPDFYHLYPISLPLPFLQSFVRSCLRGGVSTDDHYGGDYACGGGISTLLMSTTLSPFLCTLAGNPTFVSGLLAWVLAQTMKVALNFFVDRRLDMGILFSCGGMPSSHSALCMALTASVAFCHGVGDSLFAVCLGFSLIVMYDAIGVRRHAGMQAQVCAFHSSFVYGA
ncbi:uncharacterized protein LOC110025759 isoform X2 [Phalaenopsis equestris]|uniref:uncharacterized protein LOC110025759 isoform X2 n=1 Tax=Phalaenopsis equestris TaxID=78828 RepID=UPI0009E526B2|nr:uncharacterized protein LOC110025759 isoform X2 [Phalaenopsis equestris]